MTGSDLCTLKDGRTVSSLAASTFYGGLQLVAKAPRGLECLYQLARFVHQNVPLPSEFTDLLKSAELMSENGRLYQVGKLVMENALVIDAAQPLTTPYAA